MRSVLCAPMARAVADPTEVGDQPMHEPNQKAQIKGGRATVVAVALLAGIGLGTTASGLGLSAFDILKSTTALTSPAQAQTRSQQAQLQSLPSPSMPVSIADVVERVGPAVVTVHVTHQASAQPQPGFPRGTPFDEFFRRFFEGQ